MKSFLLIIAFTVLWLLGGLLVSLGLRALFDIELLIFCSALNVFAGLIMLILTTRNDTVRRLFYEGPREHESGMLLIAVLWGLPFITIFAGIIWWLLGQFFHY